MSATACRVRQDEIEYQNSLVPCDGEDERMEAAIRNSDISLEDVLDRCCHGLVDVNKAKDSEDKLKRTIRRQSEIIDILSDRIHTLADAEDPKAMLNDWFRFLTDQALVNEQCRIDAGIAG